MKVFPCLVICFTDFKPNHEYMAVASDQKQAQNEQREEFWSTEIVWVHVDGRPALRFAQIS